jgi:alkanesulfonate monooxygenase SsuD/methylene tetrahydromethanopterin reductase-like flavin-dependent oxidoreductase (luciferase family)
VNFAGKYFRCRGPLGRPPICQAGGSPRGQEFAARWADTIITDAGSVEAMKAYRANVRRRAAAAGRDPDRVKVLFLAYPLVDTTMEAARERRRLMHEDANRHLYMQLSRCRVWPPSTSRSSIQTNRRPSRTPMGIDFTVTIDHVSGMMQEIVERVGRAGFRFFNAYFDRRHIMGVCDGLMPELPRRGLTRTRYAHKHFQENLMKF